MDLFVDIREIETSDLFCVFWFENMLEFLSRKLEKQFVKFVFNLIEKKLAFAPHLEPGVLVMNVDSVS